jgi:hypothetical protein
MLVLLPHVGKSLHHILRGFRRCHLHGLDNVADMETSVVGRAYRGATLVTKTPLRSSGNLYSWWHELPPGMTKRANAAMLPMPTRSLARQSTARRSGQTGFGLCPVAETDAVWTTGLLARLLVLAMPVLVIGMADEVVLMPTAMLPPSV